MGRLHVNRSLRTQLFMIACIVIMVPLVLSSFLLFRNTVAAYGQISVRAGEMSIQQAVHALDGMLAEAVKTADAIASDPRVLEIMGKAQQDYPAPSRIEDARVLRRLLSTYESTPTVHCVRLVFPVEQQWLSNNGFTSVPLSKLEEIMVSNGFNWPSSGFLNGPVWLPHVLIASDSGLYDFDDVAYVRMVRSLDNFDRLLGYVMIMQERKDFDALLCEADLTEESVLTLCDMQGNVISQGGMSPSKQKLWDAFMQSGEASHREFGFLSQTQVLSQAMNGGKWTLSMLLPQHEYRSNVLYITLFTATTVLLLTVVTLLLATFLYRTILNRIDRIVTCMSRVSHQDLSARLIVVGRDELGSIEDNLNHMLDQIQALETQNVQMAERERLMRIRLLQTQVNPHFLYNTLNSILWVARDYHADKVCHMVKALSEFYKIGLQPGKEEATVADEILHVRKYIELQNVRGEIELDLHVEVDDALWDMYIPNMLLQPIVENSVVHGLAGQRHGIISIRIAKEAQRVRICVEDDGCGASEEMHVKLTQPSRLDNSYGLYNIRERLKLRYKDAVSITFSGGLSGRGFAVHIVLEHA